MSLDAYKPPESNVIHQDNTVHFFYIVSPQKFNLLFYSTLGFYSFYWFYRQWNDYKKSSGESIWPIPRAIFSIFFAHSLFEIIYIEGNKDEKSHEWSPALMATIYVLLTILSRVFDRLSVNEIGSPYTDFFGILILPLLALPLYKAQIACNLVCNDAIGKSNSRITPLNLLWIGLGALLWFLILFSIITLYTSPLNGI